MPLFRNPKGPARLRDCDVGLKLNSLSSVKRTAENSKWFEPESDSLACSVIVRMKVVLTDVSTT